MQKNIQDKDMSLKSTTNGTATQTPILVESNTSASKATDGDQDEKEDKATMNVIKLRVPSFIRIFVINRILFSDNNNSINCQRLVNQCFTTNITSSTIRKDAITILQQLKNNGIKKYMSKYYNEKKYAITIEMIFNKIIAIKFGQEYQKVIDFNNDYYYQSLVFNSNDLMTKIFQYFSNKRFGFVVEKADDDLNNCSLVNTHWLYHSWNINSIYHFDLKKLFEQTLKCGDDDDNVVTRSWQRLVNAKSIGFYTSSNGPNCSNTVLNKVAMLTNVEKFNSYFEEKHASIAHKILQASKDKIKQYDFRVRMTSPKEKEKENTLPPITFPNAQYIRMNFPYFYIKWSKKCDTLELNRLTNTSKNWCNYVINNCDCSGIRFLYFHNVTFSF